MYYPMLYESLQSKSQIKKSIISEVFESKEYPIFHQMSNFIDSSINTIEVTKCFTLYNVPNK